MAKLSPFIYVGAGTIVTIGSILVGEKFKLFLYVGIGFLVFGAVSAFIGAMRYRSEKKAKENGPNKDASAAQNHQNQRYGRAFQGQYASQRQTFQRESPIQEQRRAPLQFCPRCGTMVRRGDNFCFRCGLRIA